MPLTLPPISFQEFLRKKQAVGLLFSNNSNYGCPQFPRVPLKIAGAKPLQFSHNPNYGC